ncbi:nuclear transport factor 2 family protein [Luteimonas viscosa]|uniref:Nuclear transport factor 2 family protein n=1 Tax=Luteimonas viscosa TaxID=1132694 RepID=A0A5D4XUQ0_9GAMM|nr:nuclear transport factor 2 family protein [Luteimonas viscosa]TYT26722.1 nuclear transport factor 2 family protein [Luteimonas viscosa]
MSPLKKIAFITFVLLSASLQPAVAAHNEPRDVAAIREIVEAFRTSIINKDKATFVELFFSDKPEHVTWQMVDDDTRVARFKEFAPEASRVVRWPENTYLAMIDATTAVDSGSLEEVFRNVTIDTDGLVASVNFDYSTLRNGEEAHWGREMWHLVHTEDGWKIISVIWSQRDPVSDE